MIENQEGAPASESQNTVIPAQQTPPSVETPAEKQLSQHEVNGLVGSAKQKGYEKGYQQALAELQEKQKAAHEQPIMPQSVSEEAKFRKIAAEEFETKAQELRQKAIQEQQAVVGRQIAAQLEAKVNQAAEKYADFNDVVSEVDFVKHYPDILQLTNVADNAGEVLYDLAKNPTKIAQLRQYMRDLPPHLVQKELLKMSASIKANENALGAAQPAAPLSQIKPSNTGIDSGKTKSASDYRKEFAGIG